MRKSCVVLALAVLLCTSFAWAAMPRVGNSPGLAWELECKHPGVELSISVAYPQGFGKEADARLGAYAKGIFDQACEAAWDFMADRAESVREEISESGKLPEEDAGRFLTSECAFSVETASADYISVVFARQDYMGGAHGNRGTTVFSFNRQTGKALALDDVFADPGKSLPALLPLIAKAVQEQKQEGTEPDTNDAEKLDVKMERIALTPAGIRVYYDPYELASYAEGEFTADISKEALIGIGARKVLWDDR